MDPWYGQDNVIIHQLPNPRNNLFSKNGLLGETIFPWFCIYFIPRLYGVTINLSFHRGTDECDHYTCKMVVSNVPKTRELSLAIIIYMYSEFLTFIPWNTPRQVVKKGSEEKRTEKSNKEWEFEDSIGWVVFLKYVRMGRRLAILMALFFISKGKHCSLLLSFLFFGGPLVIMCMTKGRLSSGSVRTKRQSALSHCCTSALI